MKLDEVAPLVRYTSPPIHGSPSSFKIHPFANPQLYITIPDKPIIQFQTRWDSPHCALKEVSNLCWSLPHFFWLIIRYGTRADPVSIVVQNRSGGKWCFWHLIGVTKPKLQLPPCLEQQQDLFQKVFFWNKRLLDPLSFIWHLGDLCSHPGGCAIIVTVQGH